MKATKNHHLRQWHPFNTSPPEERIHVQVPRTLIHNPNLLHQNLSGMKAALHQSPHTPPLYASLRIKVGQAVKLGILTVHFGVVSKNHLSDAI